MTLEELLSSSYQVTTVGDSSYQSVWQTGTSSIYQNIWKTKFNDKEKSLKKTEREVVSQGLSGQYAIYLFHTTLTNLPEYKNCLLEGTRLLVNKVDLAFALRKNSPYLDLFNHALRKMVESGEMARIHMRYSVKEPTCNDPGKGKPLGFENIVLVFIILGAGFCISIIICTVEVSVQILKQIVPRRFFFLKI